MDLEKSKLVLETLKEDYLHQERRHSHLIQKTQALMILGTFFFAIFTFYKVTFIIFTIYNVKTAPEQYFIQQYFIQLALLLAMIFALIAISFSVLVLSIQQPLPQG